MVHRLIQEGARRLRNAKRVAVLTGAGVSKESGVSTFRDPQEGLWARYDPMQMATMEGFHRDPKLVWEWYTYRFSIASSARPNPGHYAIARLEALFHAVTVITQNIDGLHQAAGSTDVIELHGSILRHRCLNGHTGYTWDDVRAQSELPPRCTKCQALLRPEVVWFGEMLPQRALSRAFGLASDCDAMLVVGTSGEVQPAASLPYMVAQVGHLVIDVNPDRGPIANIADVFIQGPAGVVLPQLIAELAALRGMRN